jgi:hydrogenase maturation protease
MTETTDTAMRTKQILVAGIGNAWLRDDGFGGEVAKVLTDRDLPPGVQVMDFGTGGLDLAYEVMRGYDALILIDVSRQGGAAGTLYVMEAEAGDVDGQIEDGQMLDPHGMDPQTVLRFVKYVGGWPGRVFVVACEPEVVEDVGFGLSESVSRVLSQAPDVVLETVAELQAPAAETSAPGGGDA